MINKETCYDSPESDVESNANKRARTDAYDKLYADQIKDLIQKYKKSYTDEIPTKIPSTNFRDLSSLKPGKFVSESCINDWAKHLINVFDLSESVLYFPTYLYRYFLTNDKNGIKDADAEKIARYLANNKAIKKDYILVGMPATPASQHWILGVIMLNVKKITILDPIDFSPSMDYRHNSNLLRITLLAHKLVNIELQLHRWQLYHPNNIPRTSKAEDAGIFVCSFIYNIAFQIGLTAFMDKDAKEYRRRINYVLSSAKEILPQGDSKKYPRETLLECTQYLRQSFYPFCERLNISSFDVIFHDSVPMIRCGKCSDPWCGKALTSCNDMNQIRCISCRKYYHCTCVAIDQPIDYFHCYICKGS